MADNPENLFPLQRDGTSQARRRLPALQPHYADIDERSLRDHLAFLHAYSRELKYFDLDDRYSGDWSAFLGTESDLDDLAAFAEAPEKLAEAERLQVRPHAALLLTFLKLLEHTREQLNSFTRRHLDFYYRDMLRLTKRGSVPDRVHVLVTLAKDAESTRLTSGTLLAAGTDSAGKDLVYRTDRDVVVSHARVERVSSLFVDRKVTGIREAREQQGPERERVLRMFETALGEPSPGDSLPPYSASRAVNYDLLRELHEQVRFVRAGLFMEFHEFRTAMELKNRREGADEDWGRINRFLELAGQLRRGDPGFQLEPQDPRDFHANLKAALGELNFDGLPEVTNITELFEQRVRSDVKTFIRSWIHEPDDRKFVLMMEAFVGWMQTKVRIDNEWQEVNSILESSGKRKRDDAEWTLDIADPAAFSTNLQNAVAPDFSPVVGVDDINGLYVTLNQLESYFFMPARDFVAVMDAAQRVVEPGDGQEEPTEDQWSRVYAVLARAHREKVYAQRRSDLRSIYDTAERTKKRTRHQVGFDAVLRHVLGDHDGGAVTPPLERLAEYVTRDDDLAFLKRLAEAGSALEAELTRAFRVLEAAQRTREGRGEPVARKVEWLNLYAAEDARAVHPSIDAADRGIDLRWRTFGQGQRGVTPESTPPSSFGWALSSPILELSQGTRTVKLTLGFNPGAFNKSLNEKLLEVLPAGEINKGEGPFLIQVSTDDGWVEPDKIEIEHGEYTSLAESSSPSLKAIQFRLTFGEAVDPIRPPASDEASIRSAAPVLRVMLRQIWKSEGVSVNRGRYITHYQTFRTLALERVHAEVHVVGLNEFRARSEDTELDPRKPFEPFGTHPVVGTRFHVGHPEIVYKKLEQLSFHLSWMGAPEDFAVHYRNYGDFTNESFTARICLTDRRQEIELESGTKLFSTNASEKYTISLSGDAVRKMRISPGYRFDPQSEEELDLLDWQRVLCLELESPDFQHGAFPSVSSRTALALALELARRAEQAPPPNPPDPPVNPDDYHVNPPYTPKIKSLALEYRSRTEIELKSYRVGSDGLRDRVFHIESFGWREVQPQEDGECPFLPRYENEGELLIGIRGLREETQTLSVLFQMAEGSADPDLERAEVRWSYLTGNRWKTLDDGHVLSDATGGLINSGIVEFVLDPAETGTLLPSELYWIRATVKSWTRSVCDAIDLHAQAVSATFVDRNNARDHLDHPLPEESITGLVTARGDIESVTQPYTSSGGKSPEEDSEFYSRISERLRHKNRGVTLWDYERLVLERFPQIYKVKCLPPGMQTEDDALGRVNVVVIPDIRNQFPFDPFEPRVPADVLVEIQEYLAARVPTHAIVTVNNPRYAQVKVRFAVRFRHRGNDAYYERLLNTELNRFLSPWAYADSTDIEIGGHIYANSIIKFLEDRDYVDYVAHVKLFKSEEGQGFESADPTEDGEIRVSAGSPDGVLVAARQHEIDLIPDTGYEDEKFTGINYMKIELDFVVG